MALQTSGPISLADIAAEFGGSAPHSLSEYYRGGGLVPDTPANSGIPTSGAISLSDFYGGDATVGTVQISNAATLDDDPGVLVEAGFIFNPDGTITAIGNNAPTGLTWFSSAPVTDIGAGYQIRRTDANSYFTSAADQNIWVDISVARKWSIRATGAASPTNEGANLSIEIREGSSGSAEDSAVYSMNISN